MSHDRCPTCGSDDPAVRYAAHGGWIGWPSPKCTDPWHDSAAHDDDAGTVPTPHRGGYAPTTDRPPPPPDDEAGADHWHDPAPSTPADLIADEDDASHYFNATARLSARLRELEQWKAEATAVMDDWLNVWTALGKPGVLGESLAHASEQEVARLRAMTPDPATVEEARALIGRLRSEEGHADGGDITLGDLATAADLLAHLAGLDDDQ